MLLPFRKTTVKRISLFAPGVIDAVVVEEPPVVKLPDVRLLAATAIP